VVRRENPGGLICKELGMTRPIRIGVWCDYGQTLTPTEGIGVFVYNLVAGFLELDDPVEVVLLVRPGDQEMVAGFVPYAPGRLRIVPDSLPIIPQSARLTRLVQAGVRWIAWSRQKLFRLDRRVHWLGNQVRGGKFPLWPASLLTAGIGGFHVLKTTLFLPALLFRKLAPVFDPIEVSQSANCAVWLIPSVRLHHRLPVPSVLVIHDLVHVHYPEAVPPWDLEELEELVPRRSAEATICACMSGFIQDHDLRGTLRLHPNKVRMIRPAAPKDSPAIPKEVLAKPARLTRPYLFYPAAFRSYKNHAILVEAVRLLRDKHGENNLDLVFTGIHSVPQELRRMIRECGLQEGVHVLGCVDWTQLDVLYRNALATILPSLYEEVCFPVYEALQRGCPVALSRIPAFMEQYEVMHDALLYFDPNDPEDLARTILKIRDDRDEIRERQQRAAPALWARTWKDAAGDWLKVLREAVELSDKQSKTSVAA
jgi:glycosyltransferase involved in cell wall biosynthesis